MTDLPTAAAVLQGMNIPFELFFHNGPVESLEQAAKERGQLPEQVVRSIVFRVSEGSYIMTLVAGPDQISWPSLRAYLRQSRLTLATKEEVFASTGYKVGAVSPFGLPSPMRILADTNVFVPETISIGSGKRGVAIILKSAFLHQAINNIEIGVFINIKSSSKNL